MRVFLVILVSVLMSVGVMRVMGNVSSHSTPQKESVYDRVMRTQTIRCGYVPRAPMFVVDPNTKKMSGILYDVTNELGKRLNLKIEWVEETTLAEFVVGVKNGRFDTVCSGVWATAQRAREIDYTVPVLFETASAYVRADDTRFDADAALLNAPETVFSVMDGAVSHYLSVARFPAAKKVSIPENSVYSQVMLEVAGKKADVTVFPDTDAHAFSLQHPNQIKRLDNVGALSSFASAYPVARDQMAFQRMMSNAVSDMLNQGAVDTILERYPDYKGVVKRIPKAYSD